MRRILTSRDNGVLKTARSLGRKKFRDREGLYLAEGLRLVTDAVQSVPGLIEHFIASESFCEKNISLINTLDNEGKIVYITKDRLFDEISQTETPQGIAAVLKKPVQAEPDLERLSYVLILDGVSEPGNMGTIIRTAEAAGVELILLGDGCADVYAPKVVRAAMGSVFRMDFGVMETALPRLKPAGFCIAATALRNSEPIESAEISGKRALVIGSEAHGVSEAVLDAADIAVRIDMCGRVESLNAAVAAGIAMYMLRPRLQR